jgi:hypothetical protein
MEKTNSGETLPSQTLALGLENNFSVEGSSSVACLEFPQELLWRAALACLFMVSYLP